MNPVARHSSLNPVGDVGRPGRLAGVIVLAIALPISGRCQGAEEWLDARTANGQPSEGGDA